VTNAKTWSVVRDSIGREDFITLLNNEKWIYYSIACRVEILVTHFCEEMHVHPEKGVLDTNISKDDRYHHLKMCTRAYFARRFITDIIVSLENKDTEAWDNSQNDIINFAQTGKLTANNKNTPLSWAHETNTDVIKLWKQMNDRKRDTLPQPNFTIVCILYALFLMETNDKDTLKEHFKSLRRDKKNQQNTRPLQFKFINYGIGLRKFILQKMEAKGPMVEFAYKKRGRQKNKLQSGQAGPRPSKKQKITKNLTFYQRDGKLVIREGVAAVANFGYELVMRNKEEGTPVNFAGL
jgi:hypothetical protein